jgi:ABC-type sugar transport system ATPase subunit
MDEIPLLSANGLTKTFPGVLALDNVDFDLRPGEIHAILGENGAGKSTLIKIFGGVYQADHGKMLLEGQPVQFRDPREAQLCGIRVIHQELNLLPLLSVAENIFLGNFPSGRVPGTVDWSALESGASAILESLQANFGPKRLVGKLSTAEQQLVEIAQALTTDLKILVMDEPTAALSIAEVDTLFGMLRAMAHKGIGIAYITHRIKEVFRIADRVTVLRDGVKVGTLEVNSATEPHLVQMMVGRSLDEMYPRSRGEFGDVVLKVQNLRTKSGLDDISLELHRGEILGIYGLMGSGRSRLAMALFGAEQLVSGMMWLQGKEEILRSPSQARKLGLGYLPVERKTEALIMPLSLRKNLTIASLDRYARGPFLSEKREKASADEWKNKLGIRAPSIDTNIGNLSGGNQQKTVVGRWLDAQAAILIMNEPTRGIDVGSKVEIYSLMDDLCHQGVGIVMFSSEMPELLGIADRILVMSSGRITAEFARGHASQEDLMRAATA